MSKKGKIRQEGAVDLRTFSGKHECRRHFKLTLTHKHEEAPKKHITVLERKNQEQLAY